MSTSTPANTVPKIRTYATDLNNARGATGVSAPNNTNTAPTPTKIGQPLATGIIPPFHTFNHAPKNVEVTTTKLNTNYQKVAPVSGAEAQAIITSSSTKSQVIAEALPAVIITDTKHKRFSLSTELKASITNWWRGKQEAAEKRKVPKYTVPDAERRKGVIQKATAQTGRSTTADHAAVLSKIKEAKQIPHTQSTPLVPIEAKKVALPSWSTDTTPTILPSDKPSNILVTQKNRPAQNSAPLAGALQSSSVPLQKITAMVPTSAVTVPKPSLSGNEFSKIKQALVSAPPAVVPKKIIPIITPQTIAQPAVLLPTIIPKTLVVATPPQVEPLGRPKIMPIIPTAVAIAPPISVPTVAAVAKAVTATPVQNYPSVFQSEYTELNDVRPQTPATPERRFAPPRPTQRSFITTITQTNSLVFISFGMLIFIVVSGLSLRSYLASTKLNPGSGTETLPETYTTFSNGELSPVPTKVATKLDLATALKNESGTVDSLMEVTILDSATNDILTPAAFFELLDAPVLFDFKASVTNVAFGNYRGTPWITLTITDKNTALGGMLNWEKSLSTDLSPIFDIDTFAGQNIFTDGMSNTTDVRICKNSSGQATLLYGFITNNTILITGNDTAFLNLATTFRN